MYFDDVRGPEQLGDAASSESRLAEDHALDDHHGERAARLSDVGQRDRSGLERAHTSDEDPAGVFAIRCWDGVLQERDGVDKPQADESWKMSTATSALAREVEHVGGAGELEQPARRRRPFDEAEAMAVCLGAAMHGQQEVEPRALDEGECP
jgi:hypothetical protein